MDLIKGIDVSRWQGDIDWEAVRKDGYEFAAVKLTGADGGLYTDRKALENVQGALDAGLIAGGYHYAYFKNIDEALNEADYFKSVAENLGLSFVVLDIEHPSAVGDLTSECLAFLDSISSIAKAAIYASPSFIRSHLNSDITRYPLWIAHYGVDSPSTPLWGEWEIWQYTNTGSVSGISGNVDIDLMQPDFLSTGGDNVKTIVTYYGDADAFSALIVSQKYQCPLMLKSDYDASGITADEVIQIGGNPDSDRFTTFKYAASLV